MLIARRAAADRVVAAGCDRSTHRVEGRAAVRRRPRHGLGHDLDGRAPRGCRGRGVGALAGRAGARGRARPLVLPAEVSLAGRAHLHVSALVGRRTHVVAISLPGRGGGRDRRSPRGASEDRPGAAGRDAVLCRFADTGARLLQRLSDALLVRGGSLRVFADDRPGGAGIRGRQRRRATAVSRGPSPRVRRVRSRPARALAADGAPVRNLP